MGAEKDYEKLLRVVASNIRRLREARGLTQWDMSAHGFNYRHYQKLESGKYSFNLFTLFRLSKVFKVKLSEFIK